MSFEIDPKIVGLRIRDIRKQLGLSMTAFAEKLDQNEEVKKTKSGTVSNWETGKNLPNNSRLARIAELGGISVNYLLYGLQDLAGNQMIPLEISFYEYEILDATLRKPIIENELIFLFDLIKLTKGNDTLGCIVRSTCAFDGEGNLSIVCFEDCSKKFDTVFFEKEIPESIPLNKIVDVEEYLTQRKYVTEYDFTKKFFDDLKQHVIDYVSAYTNTNQSEEEVSFRFINNWNRIYKV